MIAIGPEAREFVRVLINYRPDALSYWYSLPLLFLILAGFAIKAPNRSIRIARRIQFGARAFLLSPARSMCAAALMPVACGILFVGFHGFPCPSVHDEFSYLLAADTFAHGRLANPPSPMWVHFETFHVNQLPTYSSMYPPGQGLLLFLGTVIFGHPWFGVWFGVVSLSVAVSWALRAWAPPEWAFFGGLAAATVSSFSYWMTTYWGGAPAAAGGALLIGAWPRLERKPTAGFALVFALGAIVLANTRMYEGAVLTLAVTVQLVWSAIRRPIAPARVYLKNAVLPGGIALLLAAAWMMFCFWRVTGSPTLMPYVLNARTYLYRPLFIWQDNRALPPNYRHEPMRRLYVDEFRVEPWTLKWMNEQITPTVKHYGTLVLLLPLAALPWLIRKRRVQKLHASTYIVIGAVLVSTFVRPHYLAPALAGLIGLAIQALRYLHAWRPMRRRAGRFAVRGVLAFWLVMEWKTGFAKLILGKFSPEWAVARAEIQHRLEQLPGPKHLILVRYDQLHSPHREWVFNGADLFDSRVLWAREMDAERNRILIEHFRDRTIWLLEPDRDVRLAAYPR